jgi:hypothetical protein
MSDHESFDVVRENPSEHGIDAYSRWPGLLSLSLGFTLGPVAALANQQLIYGANMWACGRNQPILMHIAALLCLAVAIGTGITAHANWKAAGGGVDEEEATIATRTRFAAIAGIGISAFSALVILAQWAAVFVFDPCMRA